MKTNSYYSNAKLLISGEYVILNGSLALALPLVYGQGLEVYPQPTPRLSWKSWDNRKNCWFKASFDTDPSFKTNDTTDPEVSDTLRLILKQIRKLNPLFLIQNGAEVHTFLNFDRNWGLGTSSTLLNNLAQWAQVDAFVLQKNTWGGSGYDIACAQSDTPILYSTNNKSSSIRPVQLTWPFVDQLYFVYLNQKQDTHQAIKKYRANANVSETELEFFSQLTLDLLASTQLTEFETLLRTHENHLGELLQLPPVHAQLFTDYPGAVKSLGAWGGDFVLATRNFALSYFPERGYTTIFPFTQLVKSQSPLSSISP